VEQVAEKHLIKVRDAIKKAVDERNATLAGRIADVARFRYGLNYNATVDMVNRIMGRDVSAEWEGLMYEADGQNEEDIDC
jgi:hypothetical protein